MVVEGGAPDLTFARRRAMRPAQITLITGGCAAHCRIRASMDLRRKNSSVMPYRLTLWFVVLLVAALLFLDRNPWQIDEAMPVAEPVDLTREASSDVVVVIDWEQVAESPERFSEKDWSAAWINLFEQEIGPITIATPGSLSQPLLEASRVVVLTSSVTGDVPEPLVRRLRQWLLDGRLLVIERPQGALREAFSANGEVGTQRGQRISYARHMPEPFNGQLRRMPLSTQYIGSTAAREGATTILAIDGAPAIYEVPIGQGHAITVDFDLGEQLVALQQGRPAEDFTVRGADEIPRTSDLVLDPTLLDEKAPFADLLERFVVYSVIQPYAPLPGFWLFPANAEGAVVAMHPDDELGDGGGWMLEHEASRRGVSTLFTSVDSGMTASGAALIHRRGGEIGLLWRMQGTPVQLLEPFGLWGFEPLARPVDLGKQLDRLVDTVPADKIRAARVMGGFWSPRWEAPLSALASREVLVDSSYGVPEGAGYAFGTGLPFLAMDRSGHLLSIRELPVVVPSAARTPEELTNLLQASQAGHHQAIGVSTRPASFADYPDLERFNAWLAMFDAAERTGHIVTSAGRLDAFLRARRSGGLRSRVIEGATIPRARRAPAGDRAPDEDDEDEVSAEEIATGGDATLLRITVEAKWRAMAVVVPSSLGHRDFVTAREKVKRVGDELVSGEIETQKVTYAGYPLQRINLESGFNTIDVYYR